MAGPGSSQAPHHAAELGIALGWVAAGIAVSAAAWRMDRLEALSINPYSVPGLVPGIVGMLMALFGLIVASRAWRERARARQAHLTTPPSSTLECAAPMMETAAPAAGPSEPSVSSPAIGRAIAAAALCIVFGGLLPGRGLPFIVVGAVFIFLFILIFGTPPKSRLDPRRIAAAAAVAVAASVLITYLFGDVFLVRLP